MALSWEQRLFIRMAEGRMTPHDKKILAARKRKYEAAQRKKKR